MNQMPAVNVRGVSKRFGETRALESVSLQVPAGAIVGLLGPNGAGKTTLVRVLATLLAPDAGQAIVGGVDVMADPGRARALIGLAGQSAAIDELLTGRENLELIGRLYGCGRAETVKRAKALLGRLDLVDAGDRRVGTYSGGMRRRLDLGATLMGHPSVLLLDEPTAGLDPRSRTELWSMIEEVAGEGTAVLLTTQYLEEVDRLASAVVVIDHGRVITEGTPDELKARTGGAQIELQVGDSDVDRAAIVLTPLGVDSPTIDHSSNRIRVPAHGGPERIVEAARACESAGIAVLDLGWRRPSLDEVFLTLTGKGAEPPGSQADSGPVAGVQPAAIAQARRVRPPFTPGRWLSDVGATTGRYLRRHLRTPQLLFFGTVWPVVFVFGLSGLFGTLVERFLGTSYTQYLLPGVIVMNLMLMGGTTGIGLADDMRAGIIDRFRSLPMARSAVVVGRTTTDLCRNAVAIVFMIAAGFLIGYRLHAPLLGGLAAFGVALLFGYALSWVFATVGLAVKDPQTASFIGFAPVMPLVFLSGAWIPVQAMDSHVQGFARNQPVNVTIEAVRALATNSHDYHLVWQSMTWSLAILVVFTTLATRLYQRR